MSDKVEVFRKKSLEALFNNSIDAMVSIDASYSVVDANRAFLEMFGYAMEEVAGRHVYDIMNTGKPDTADINFSAAVLAGKQMVAEEIQRCSGTHFDPHLVKTFLELYLPERS